MDEGRKRKEGRGGRKRRMLYRECLISLVVTLVSPQIHKDRRNRVCWGGEVSFPHIVSVLTQYTSGPW